MEYDWSKRFSLLAQRTRPPEISWLMAQALEVPGLISLAAGFVDQESLPHEEVSRILEPLLREKSAGQAALQYGTTQGDLELRQLLVQRLRAEGVFHPAAKIDESHMLIGSGSQQVLYLAAEALLDEGDIILLEAPTYFVVLGILQSRNLRTFGIDTDADGIVVEKVEECLAALEKRGEISRVKMLYLMSYATNPLGITLAPERRKRLLALLQSYREKGYPILLLEDAAYRRLGFADPIPHPIKSLEADNDLVLYTESFSKTLSPGFRLGFGVGPKSLIDKMVDLKGNHDFGSSNLNQQLLKTILSSGTFDAHGQTLRRVYARKCEMVLGRMAETFPPQAHWLRPTGSFYTWVTLPEAWDTGPRSEIFKRALAQKVLYVPGCLCYSPDRPEAEHASSMRLCFGMIGEQQLLEGYARIARALREVMG